MSNDRDLDGIFDRIAKRNATDEDIQTLRQLLRVTEGQSVIQIGKYSVNITEGREIHIGDKIYQSTDAETIRVIVQQVLAEKIRDDTFQRLFSPSESSLVDWDWGMNLLKKKQLPEIRKRLTDTLGRDRILMDVSIEERQRWVNRSPLAADRTLQVDGKDGGTLDANKMLIETFGRDDIEKKLLILGAPGAGKTTALLSLAEQLVEGAISQPRTVIPVIFELSTWRNDNQSIESWLIEQLYELHGGNRKSKLYEQWLERQVLLPLLDGLDELGLERHKKCTQKLNEFSEHYPQLVVCCRVKEFETVDIKLRSLRGAVCLQSLSDLQIQHYFDSLQRPELWKAIQTTPSLQAMLEPTTDGDPGLLRVPLFVKLVVDVYDPQQPISGKADLLDKYIARQLSVDKREIDRRKELDEYKWAYQAVENEPDMQQTSKWLCWIAQYLYQQNQTEFLIERIQPAFLNKEQIKDYKLIFISIASLIMSANEFTNTGSISSLPGGFIVGSIGSIFSFTQPFKPVEYFKFNINRQTWKKYKIGLMAGSITGLIVSAMITIVVCFNANISTGIAVGIFGILIVTPITALTMSFILGMNQDLKIRFNPNQGIINSCKAIIFISLFSYPFSVVFNSLYVLRSSLQNLTNSNNFPNILSHQIVQASLIASLAPGIHHSLLFGLFFGGGLACVQHLSTRLLLWQRGIIPWNFAHFLNYCVERRLLLRVGGSYRFLHRELLDHFAQSSRWFKNDLDFQVSLITNIPATLDRSSPTPPKTATHTIDPAIYRRKVRQVFREAVNHWESGYDEDPVAEELLDILADAEEFFDNAS
jgi:Effector-associated domain 10/NACHT domain